MGTRRMGTFVVPEDEDEGGLGVAGVVGGVVVEKGGVKRVVIRPIIRGPYKEGDEVTADVRELLKWTWKLMGDSPIDVASKRPQESERIDGGGEEGEKGRRTKRKRPAVDSAEEVKEEGAKGEAKGGEEAAACTPQVKKKPRRVIVPLNASTLASHRPSSLAPGTPAAAASTPVPPAAAAASYPASPPPVAPQPTPPSPPPQSSVDAPAPLPAAPAAVERMEREVGAGEGGDELGKSGEGEGHGMDVDGVESTASELSTEEVSELGSELAAPHAGQAAAIAI